MNLDLLDPPASSEVLSHSEWTVEKAEQPIRRNIMRSSGTSSSAAGPLVVRFGKTKLVFPEPPPDWFRVILRRICALGELPHNWDSYGGRSIDPCCAAAAIKLLLSTVDPDTPSPSVVPTNRGGLQIEWHRSGIDLEIEVNSPFRFHMTFEDTRIGEAWEKTVAGDLRPMVSAVKRLTAKE